MKNELRLGNVINYLNTPTQLDVELFLSYLKYTTPFEPILLNEQILLSCGFEEYMYKGDLRIPILNGVLMSVIIDEDFVEVGIGDEITLKKIKYLHQLQNLYFVLTGTELEIKL